MIKSKGRGRNLLSTKEITEEIERLKEEAQRRMDATNGIEEWMAEKFKSLKDRLKKYEEGASFHSNRHDDIGNRLEKLEKLAANHEQFCNNYAAMLAGTLEKQESLQQEIKELKEDFKAVNEWIEDHSEKGRRLAATVGRIDEIDGKYLDDLCQRLSTQEDKIKALKGQISRISDNVQSMGADIQSEIMSVRNNVNNNYQAIHKTQSLQERIEKLELETQITMDWQEEHWHEVHREINMHTIGGDLDDQDSLIHSLQAQTDKLENNVASHDKHLCEIFNRISALETPKENNLEVIERAREIAEECQDRARKTLVWAPTERDWRLILKALTLAEQSIKGKQ
jgi:DNA repair exonuclease SbcCD ATPase subunit